MRLNKILYYALGTLILCLGAFYNTYPFINGDTSVYITSGLENYVPYERPIFYGYFLKITSLTLSLWLTGLAQGFILFWLLDNVIRSLYPNASRTIILLLVSILGISTGVWWETTKLMADVFTAFMTIGLLLLILDKEASTAKKVLYWVITLYATTGHNSHLLILTAAPFALWVAFRIAKLPIRVIHWPILLLIPLSWLLVCGANYIDNGKFVSSRASHVFIMGKLVENGMLKHHLDRTCHSKDWKICAYADSLPLTGWQFIWDASSPMQKTGGWIANEKEYNEVLHSIVTTPKHLALLLYKSVIETGIQLTQCNYGTDLMRCDDQSNIQQTIYKYYGHEYNRSRWSRQSNLELPFVALNYWYYLFLSISTIMVAYLYSIGKVSNELIAAYIFLGVLLIINAYVSANFANIADRLNTRIFWLIPLLHIISIAQYSLPKWNKNNL